MADGSETDRTGCPCGLCSALDVFAIAGRICMRLAQEQGLAQEKSGLFSAAGKFWLWMKMMMILINVGCVSEISKRKRNAGSRKIIISKYALL